MGNICSENTEPRIGQIQRLEGENRSLQNIIQNIERRQQQELDKQKGKYNELYRKHKLLENELKQRYLYEHHNTLRTVKIQQDGYNCILVENKVYVLKEDIEESFMIQKQQLHQTIAALNDRLAEYQNELKALKVSKHNLEAENMQLKFTYGDLLSPKNTVQLGNEHSDNYKFRQYDSHIEHLNTTLSNRNDKIDKLNKRIERLNQELSQVTATSKTHHQDFSERTTRMQELIEDLKQRLSNSNHERDLCQFQNNKLLNQIEELQSEYKNLYRNQSQQNESYEMPVQYNFEDIIKNMQEHINKLTQSVLNLEEERDLLQQKIKYLECGKPQIPFVAEAEKVKESNLDYLTEDKPEENPSSAQIDHYVNNALHKIEDIRNYIENINEQVEKFSGTQEDKVFLHLKEMLIQSVLTLDNIDAGENHVIRGNRKDVIKRAHQVLSSLIDRCVH